MSMRDVILKLATDETSRSIVELLAEKELSFTDLHKELQHQMGERIHRESFSRQLRELARIGVIYQQYKSSWPNGEKGARRRFYSFYKLAPMGRSTLGKLTKLDQLISQDS
jgi:DNA-binding HxlR family transcriptional regulator